MPSRSGVDVLSSGSDGSGLPGSARSSSSITERLWLRVANAVVTIGYLYGLVRRALLTRRRYKRVRLGPLIFRVPRNWEQFEPAPEGDFVLRNQRITPWSQGDALWYSTFGEIRVRRPGVPGLPELAPMDELRRELDTSQGGLVVLLRVARGMGPSLRAEAERAFRSARALRRGPVLEWTDGSAGSA